MIIGLAAVALLAGCTSARHDPARTTGTATPSPSTPHASTRSMPPSTHKSTPKPVPTGPIRVGPVKAVEGDCPYISVTDAATKEGNRIDKHFVLMARGKVVGCRFLFWTDAYAVLEITKQTYVSADAAYNAMVRIGKRGANFHGVQDLVPGVDGILYQTTFYDVDGPTDWACTFATGRTVVTVKTAQNNVEFNARAIAKAIAPKF
jgi:hypothetical protein